MQPILHKPLALITSNSSKQQAASSKQAASKQQASSKAMFCIFRVWGVLSLQLNWRTGLKLMAGRLLL